MDNLKNNHYYVKKILTDLCFIMDKTNGLTKEEIEDNEILTDSIMFRLIQISENSEKLSKEFKENYKHIPWHAIKGLRNRIVHEYGNVDLSIIYETITKDIPDLLATLESIL